MTTTHARKDGHYLMALGSIAFLLFGVVLMSANRVPLLDFRTAYYSGQCLLHTCDPYSPGDIDRLYSQHVERYPLHGRDREVITNNIYLPPAFAFTVPLALFPFGLAQALWFVAITGSFILAAYLMWGAAAEHAPVLAAALLAFLLANSGSLVYFGNPAGFVVSLTVIAAWCFVHERFAVAGIFCLAVSLAFKPHDAGFVWLYFLLAGGAYRKRALQTLAVLAAFGIPAALWVVHVSPHWLQEMSSNLQVYSAPGGMNDPSAGHGSSVLTNLQTITSFLWPDPHSYNLAAYLISAPFFLVWAFVTLRAKPSHRNAWMGLAAVGCFTLLPVYHRQYDAKLILLVIPALALVWSARGLVAQAALAFTTAAFVLNGDIPWVIFLSAVKKLHLSQAGPHGRLLTAVWDFSVPLSLLALGLFFLWVYARAVFRAGSSAPAFEPASAHLSTR